MIVISGTVAINPEKHAQAVAAALEMSAASEAEAGCVTYRFYADLEDPNLFRIFEVWEREDALAAHFETAHMAVFRKKMPDLVAGPMDVKRYDVDKVSDL